MQTADYLSEITRSGHRLADVAPGRLDVSVPSCPGWTMADLVFHLAGVQASWTAIGSGRPLDEIESVTRPPDDELVEWYRAGVDATVARLAQQDPATERWNWSGRNQTAGWIQRRMAQESAMHSWDGLVAAGQPEAIPMVVAIDGIDEFLDVFVGACADRLTGPVETVHVHVTDGDGEWLLTEGAGSSSLERTHAKGDVAVRGPASDLLLTLWSRPPADPVDVIGDAGVLARLLATATF
jgi:uncharacterized protein (TIGR03083 family)